jgi:hypothetical protein
VRNLIELPTIQNVTPNGHCVLSCPLGMTYDAILFQLTNVTAATMSNFKVKAGSQSIIDVSNAGVLDSLNAFYSRANQAGFFTLWFYRPEMRTEVEAAMTSFGTVDIKSLTIEFDLGATANPAIKAYCIQRDPQPMGLVTKIREYPVTFAAAGLQQIDNIPRGARISAFHLRKGDVSACDLDINYGQGPVKIVQATKGTLEAVQKSSLHMPRVPQTANYTHIDLNLLGTVNGPLPTANLQDMRLKPTIDSAGTLTTVVEYIDGAGGI